MSGGLLSLKWNNHQSTFLNVLSTLCLNDTLSDVTLACEGEFFAAHKLVLATCSEYFERIFEQIEGKHSVIVLKDVKGEELEALLSYMYEGEVNVLHEKLPGLINAAEYLKVKGLSDSDDTPKNFSNQSLNNQQKDRSSPCEEVAASPRPKRKRQNSECDDAALSHCSSPVVNSNGEKEKELVRESNTGEAQLFRDGDETLSRPEQKAADPDCSSFGLDLVKEEPSEPGVKAELSYILPNESSQFSHPPSGYFPTISEGCLPTMPSLSESEKDTNMFHTEENTTSSNVWESSGSLTGLLNTNRIGLLRIKSEAEQAVTPSQREDMTITPDNFVPLLHEMENTETSGIFSCPLCAFTTSQKNVFDTHLRRHSSEKTFYCQYCSYSCLTKSNLKCHVRKHTGEKPFGCPFCNYRSSQSSNIKIHVRRMHKEVSFGAINSPSGRGRRLQGFQDVSFWSSFSGSLAVNSSSVAEPKRTGSSSVAKKTKVCPVCSKSFFFDSHLRKHLLIHTGDTPFACTLCTYRANRRENLNRHIRNHKVKVGNLPGPST